MRIKICDFCGEPIDDYNTREQSYSVKIKRLKWEPTEMGHTQRKMKLDVCSKCAKAVISEALNNTEEE